MANIKRFFRLDYVNDAALEAMVTNKTAVSPDQDFSLALQAGDGILLARFNEHKKAGEVRAIGVVTSAPGSSAVHRVDWVRVTESLYPSPQGMKFWRQTKPWFVFAKSVIPGYRLPQLFEKHFTARPGPASQTGDAAKVVISPVQTTVKSIADGSDVQGVGSVPLQNDRAGYVYLIHSVHGYKIGKTKRMKERSQLFSVKLPFEIDVVHYAWFEDYSIAEAALHRRFREQRLGGEWFQLTPADVQAIKEFRL